MAISDPVLGFSGEEDLSAWLHELGVQAELYEPPQPELPLDQALEQPAFRNEARTRLRALGYQGPVRAALGTFRQEADVGADPHGEELWRRLGQLTQLHDPIDLAFWDQDTRELARRRGLSHRMALLLGEPLEKLDKKIHFRRLRREVKRHLRRLGVDQDNAGVERLVADLSGMLHEVLHGTANQGGWETDAFLMQLEEIEVQRSGALLEEEEDAPDRVHQAARILQTPLGGRLLEGVGGQGSLGMGERLGLLQETRRTTGPEALFRGPDEDEVDQALEGHFLHAAKHHQPIWPHRRTSRHGILRAVDWARRKVRQAWSWVKTSVATIVDWTQHHVRPLLLAAWDWARRKGRAILRLLRVSAQAMAGYLRGQVLVRGEGTRILGVARITKGLDVTLAVAPGREAADATRQHMQAFWIGLGAGTDILFLLLKVAIAASGAAWSWLRVARELLDSFAELAEWTRQLEENQAVLA